MTLKKPAGPVRSSDSMLGETIAHYDAAADAYDQQYTSAQWKVRQALTVESLRGYLPDDGMLLDAGAGTGRSTEILISPSRAGKVVCLDASRGMLRKLRAKHAGLLRAGRIFIVLGDVLRLPFSDAVFDFVFSQGLPLKVPIFQNLPAEEISRVLKTGCYMATIVGTMGNSVLAKLVEGSAKSMQRGVRPRVGLPQILRYVREGKVEWENASYSSYALEVDELKEICVKAGLTIVEMIGNPMIVHRLSREAIEFLLSDPATETQILDLERLLSKESSMIGNAGNLQIIARKEPRPLDHHNSREDRGESAQQGWQSPWSQTTEALRS